MHHNEREKIDITVKRGSGKNQFFFSLKTNQNIAVLPSFTMGKGRKTNDYFQGSLKKYLSPLELKKAKTEGLQQK